MSRSEDTDRPPYGRVTVRTARRCVLVGTTNSEEYLRDEAEEALDVMKGNLNAATDREIASVLRDLRFRKRIQSVATVRRRVWVAREALRTALE